MTTTQDAPNWRDCLTRARLLIERHHYSEAAQWCQRGLQDNPDQDQLYAALAICWMHTDGREDAAVDCARRCVGIDPEDSSNHAILALALCHRAKPGQDGMLRESLDAARKSLDLDAGSIMAHSAQIEVLSRLQRWREAEVAAREAIAIDPENPHLGAQFAVILQRLGKHEDHEQLARAHLEQHPESESAHCNAGLNALRKGDHKAANQHFLEALRLNPASEMARYGLAESYRLRSFFYRWLVKMDSGIRRMTGGRETAFWIGGYIVYRMAYGALQNTAPLLAWLLLGAWLMLVFWSSLARGLSSFFMLFDPFASHSLRTRDKWEAGLVGGMVFLAIACLVGGVIISAEYAMAALALFLAATPISAALTNDHHLGRWLYGAAMVYCIGAALYFTVSVFLFHGWDVIMPDAYRVVWSGIWTAIIFSWVSVFRILYR
jgi:tetratricopeptide (TPR) repeat protein